MVEERRPQKRVVKKVVKKTVVRPAQTGTTTLRTPTRSSDSTTATKVPTAEAPPAATGTALARLRARAATARRPSIRIPSPPRRPGAGLGEQARLAGSRVLDRGRDASFAVGRGFRSGFDRVRDVRLPYLSPIRAAAVTGVVVGLAAVLMGYLALQLFSATSGAATASGWKALAFVVVAFTAFAVGELLLGGFGVEHGRVISLMSIMLVLVLILTFFLDLAAGRSAWILLPLLGAISFAASCRIILFAAEQPERR